MSPPCEQSSHLLLLIRYFILKKVFVSFPVDYPKPLRAEGQACLDFIHLRFDNGLMRAAFMSYFIHTSLSPNSFTTFNDHQLLAHFAYQVTLSHKAV